MKSPIRRLVDSSAILLVLACLPAGGTPSLQAAEGSGAGGGAPRVDLAAQAKALAQDRLRRLGEGYVSKIDTDRHIVYVSAVDENSFAFVIQLLSAHGDLQRRMLFPHPLQWNVTVILPTLGDYRKYTPSAKALGHYQHETRTLYSISFSDILLHEFTHALHHNDQALARQQHPIWIVEGLATLFQRAKITQGGLQPLLDPTVANVQKAVRDKKAYPLEKLFAMDQKAFMKDDQVCYTQARYVMLYLYQTGRLKDFYASYKAAYAGDVPGIKTLEKTLAKSLKEIDEDWRSWVLSQEPPWKPGYEQKAHLGIKMKPTPEGVLITALLPATMAQKTNLLQPNDVIISLAGQATPSPLDLAAAVQSCRPGEIVDIEIIRGGRTMVVKQLLGLMPK